MMHGQQNVKFHNYVTCSYGLRGGRNRRQNSRPPQHTG